MTTMKSKRRDQSCISQSSLTLETTRSSRNSNQMWSLRLWRSTLIQPMARKRLSRWRLCQILFSCAWTKRSFLICVICSLRLLITSREKQWREESDSLGKRTWTPRSTGTREAKSCSALAKSDRRTRTSLTGSKGSLTTEFLWLILSNSILM